MSAGDTEAEKGYIMRMQARAHHTGLREQGLCPKSTAAEPTGTANIKIKRGKTSNSQTGNTNARCGTYKRGALPGSSSAPRERGVQACGPRCTRGHPGGIPSSSLVLVVILGIRIPSSKITSHVQSTARLRNVNDNAITKANRREGRTRRHGREVRATGTRARNRLGSSATRKASTATDLDTAQVVDLAGRSEDNEWRGRGRDG
ncbi:hypothetical protein V8D89_001264 [Ganoderma adspersum]